MYFTNYNENQKKLKQKQKRRKYHKKMNLIGLLFEKW